MSFFTHLARAALSGTAMLTALAVGLLPDAGAQPQGRSGIDAASAVAVVVKVPMPWYAPRSVVIGRMRDTAPQYAALPGLAHKAFSLTQADAQYGGIHLWKDQASAHQWFNDAWKERVLKTYGSAATLEWFDTPILLPSQRVDNQPAILGL